MTPASNCTFGCTYCYVPTMRVQGGLKPEDWRRWGLFSTFKQNAADLLRRELRPDMAIYCSPLTDPYQPLEAEAVLMPDIWRAVAAHPPRVFVLQTRGPLVLRDIDRIRAVPAPVRIGISIGTDDDGIRRRFEPHCASICERLNAVETLRRQGLDVFVTLAPLLPCHPEALIALAAAATPNPILGDPLHLRATKPRGATTPQAAFRILDRLDTPGWATPGQQAALVVRMKEAAAALGTSFHVGPAAFGLLAR